MEECRIFVVIKMFELIFDNQYVLILNFKKPGLNFRAERNKENLKRLHGVIKNNHLGNLIENVILPNDNGCIDEFQTLEGPLTRMR